MNPVFECDVLDIIRLPQTERDRFEDKLGDAEEQIRYLESKLKKLESRENL